MKITSSKKHNCPICQQWMDIEVISCRNKPFIDGKCYPKLCFTCWWVPIVEIQHYDHMGNIVEIEGPFFDRYHLMTPEQMVKEHICEKLRIAKACVKAVTELCKDMTEDLDLKRPGQEIQTWN